MPAEASFFKHANAPMQEWAVANGLLGQAARRMYFSSISSRLRKFQLAAEGKREPQPPDSHRARIRECFDPLPFWYPPVRGRGGISGRVSAARDHPAPDGDVSFSWGSQNAWLRQIHAANALFVPSKVCDAAGLAGWRLGRVISPHGRIHGAGDADGCAQRADRLDMERHRQAQRRLDARVRMRRKRARASC